MDKFPVQNQMDECKEITRSPQMNKAAAEAVKIIEGIGDQDAFHDALIELDQAAGVLIKTFKNESRFQEKTDFFMKESQIINENFSKLKEGIHLMKNYFKSSNKDDVEQGMTQSIAAFRELFASFDRLKEKEKEAPVHSKSPFMNEIIRVAQLIKRNKLPKELLKERIDTFLFIQQNFAVNFEYMTPSLDEKPIFDEHKEEVRKQINNVIEGLKLANTYVVTNNLASLDEGLEKAKAAVDYLLDFEDKLANAREAPKVKLCFQCSTENPRSAKYCVKCNFSFPPLQMEEESTMDFRLDESGIQQTGHVMTENVVKMFNAVENIKSGAISMDEFKKTLIWFQQLISKANEEQKKIPDPQSDENPEAMDAFLQFKETFIQGVKYMEEGLERLQLFCQNQSPDLLETGMESIFQGGDLLYQVKLTSDQIAASMQQGAN